MAITRITRSTSNRAGKPVKTRVRRRPTQLLEDLKAELARITARFEAKRDKLQARIARIETKYEQQLTIAQFTQQSEAELAQQLQDSQRNARLMRQALKLKQTGKA